MKSKLVALVLVLGLALSGCCSAEIRKSIDSLEKGLKTQISLSEPRDGVDPNGWNELNDLLKRHLEELRKEAGG